MAGDSIDSLFAEAFAHLQAERMGPALAAYDALLARAPQHYDALVQSGVLLYKEERYAEARSRISAALALQPGAVDALTNLAAVQLAQGDLAGAEANLTQALRRAPGVAGIWAQFARLELARGESQAALAAYEQAAKLDPANPAGWFNLAVAMKDHGSLADALDAGRQALALAGPHVMISGLVADLHLALGRPDAALKTLEALGAAGAVGEHQGVILRIMARAYDALGRADEALAAYERAAALLPDEPTLADEWLYLAKREVAWDVAERIRRTAPLSPGVMPSPFSLLSEGATRAMQRSWAARHAASFAAAKVPLAPPPRRGSQLRVGYLSADLHHHATAILAAGLFEAHERQGFEVFAYSYGIDDGSDMRRRIETSCENFLDVSDWSDPRIVARMRADALDVVVDLKGYTEHARTAILAERVAPVQVNYLGFPGTMAAPFIDYIVGDPVVTPFEHAADYGERIVQLPHSYQINDRKRALPAPLTRRGEGLPEAAVLYASFNNTYKINPDVFDAWASILGAQAHGVLWLLAPDLDRPLVRRLKGEIAARGVDPERLLFARHRPYNEYLGLLALADVFLDTWPYNAHTTASDALWAGCPVVTWAGATFASRVGTSLVRAAGVAELAVADRSAYIQLAVTLGADAARRRALRERLLTQGRASPLFDTQATTRALERAYRRMVADVASGNPVPFRVDP